MGCVALISTESNVFALSRMTITRRMPGLRLGRKLLGYAIAQARAIGENSLFLSSNTRLENAIHLNEAVRFRYIGVARTSRPVYVRENQFMELPL